MATDTQRTRFRRKLNVTIDDFSDAVIDDIFLEASEVYPTVAANDRAMMAASVLEGIKQLRAQYALRASYTQNASSESLSDVFRALDVLAKEAQKDLDSALAGAGGVVRMGTPRPTPRRWEEYPDDY